MTANLFVFDIETIPDVAGGRRLYGLDDLDDGNAAAAMFHIRSQEAGGSEFLRHHLHRIVAISVVLRTADRFKVWSLGEVEATEEELLRRFFDGVDRFTPVLVSWNGSGFDLPVIQYLSRYHERHTDLMDVLSGYQPRAVARLDEIATLLGLPGKMGMSGEKVWESYQAGNIVGIRNYCETDVLNTYLVYLRFELIRGHLTEADYARECRRVREELAIGDKPHLHEFLQAWDIG
jgi:predicted PolB exonuclease-like 3'-5' exonuclease